MVLSDALKIIGCIEDNQIELNDCRKYVKLIPTDYVNLIVIDPPYNELPKDWDDFKDWELLKYEFKRILKDNGQIYIFGKQPMLSNIYYVLRDLFDFRFELIWNKNKGLWSSNYMPMRSHELIWCFKKKSAKPSELTFDIDSIKREGKPYVRKNKAISSVRNNWEANRTIIKDGMRFPLSVLNHSAVINRKEKIKHPTQKPLDILKWIIKSSSKPSDMVLDCFMGSGTTAVACIELNRNFLGCEQDKEFYNASQIRLSEQQSTLRVEK